MKKINKLWKLLPALTIVSASMPLVSLTNCGGDNNITISEADKSQTVDSTGAAIYTFTLKQSATSTEDFATPVVSDVSDSSVSLSASIYSVSDKTLKIKVQSTTNNISDLDVTFTLKITKADKSWTQTFNKLTLKGISTEKYTVKINAGEHGYFGTSGTITKTVGEFNKVSVSDLTEPTSEDSTKYTFTGWYKTAECVDKFDFSQTLTADTTIYAGWAEVPVVTPSIDYDENLFTVTSEEEYTQTKIVNITPIAGQTITTDSPVKITGTWTGYQFNFIPSEDDSQELEIDLNNFVLIGKTTSCPFNIQKANDGEENEMSFKSVEISVTKNTSNYIYDARTYGASGTDELKGAINCKADLKIKATGFLKINDSTAYKGFSQGIHCTKDLTIQKCTLNVAGYETAIKGNKSIEIKSNATVTATSATGDGLKTEDIDVSSKGKRRGDITITDNSTVVTVNSTKDAFQAAHNLYIGTDKDGAAATTPTIIINTGTFNKKWSQSVVTDSQDFYFRSKYSDCSTFCNPANYTFGVYFTNSSTATNGEEVEATLKKITAGSEPSAKWEDANAYWNCNRPYGYSKAFIKLYDSTGTLKATSSAISLTSSKMDKDLVNISSISTSKFGTISWVQNSYKKEVSGSSGERAGKTSYSSKGMKAANLFIAGGTITASVCDDFIHTKYGQLFPAGGETTTLEKEVGAGNVTITGGTITLNDCPDDGIHADGTLTIGTAVGAESDLTIQLTPDRDYNNSYCCYEGLEASIINIKSGTTKVYTKDDGVNASCCGNTVLTSVNINVSGGLLDITAKGDDVDGIDTNYCYEQSGGTVISRGTQGTALDIGDTQGSKATITSGTLILMGKNEAENKMTYTGTTKTDSLRGKSKGTYTLKIGDSTFSIYFKYDYTSTGSVYSSLGSASWN